MSRFVVSAAFCLAAVATEGSAQAPSSSPDIVGVWRTVEARNATGKDITDRSEQNQFIFTRRHFSIAWAEIPRSKVDGVPTDSQKAALWQEFSFEAGTYNVFGDTLTLNSNIAKSPRAMELGAFQKFVIVRDGSAIWLQLVADNRGPLPHQERIKLVRFE